MRALRLPLRLARREVRRRPGRTALVALLVALPVAGMAIAVTMIRTGSETSLEQWTRTHGQAEAAGLLSDLDAAELPKGSRQVEVGSTWVRAKGADGTRAGVELSDLPLLDPITAGIHDLVAGRVATQPGEVVVSTATRDHFAIGVGDDLVLDRPELTVQVVGVVEPAGCLSCHHIVFAPGELPVPSDGGGTAFVLIDLPDMTSLADQVELQRASLGNIAVRDVPSLFQRDDGGEAVRWSLVLGALVLTVVGIVISAAFAVGARRQLVTLGQLSASGASPGTIRAALVLQGTVTGIVGSVGGLVFGGALLLVGQPLVERLLDKRINGYDARPIEVAAVVLIGVAAATLAALIPARTAARVPTLAALAGRRPLAPVSRRLIAWGAMSVLGGLCLLFIAVLGGQSGSSGDLWALVAIVGGVAELLGACAIAPALISRLEPLAQGLRGSLRLGARSLARHRARTGAVVSAVAAAGALAVAAGGLILGTEAQHGVETAVPDDVLVVQSVDAQGLAADGPVSDELGARIIDELPDAEEVAVRRVVSTDDGEAGVTDLWRVVPAGTVSADGFDVGPWHGEGALVADDALLDALRASEALRNGLEETGGAMLASRGSGFQVEGPIDIVLPDGRSIPGVSVPHRFTPGYVSNLLITEETAADLGLEVSQVATIFETPEAFTAAQRAGIEELMYDESEARSSDGSEGYTSFQWSSPDSRPSPFQLELILSGVALVFSLFVVGVSLALAAAESKDERDILTIAGAPPRLLARSAGARAWLLAVLGAGMAVPVGFLPVVVFAMAQRQDTSGGVFDDQFPIVFPTRTVLLLLVAVPLIVALVAWVSSASAQRFRPVRVSTAVFE